VAFCAPEALIGQLKPLAMRRQLLLLPLHHLFSDFFAVELDINDKLIKYGKAKGWPHQQPLYLSQT